jgi:hypothetical protein
VDLDTWWHTIERARAAVGARADDRNHADDPLPAALADELATLSAEELVDWSVTHVSLVDTAYRHALWNAAYLIEGGCGDDGFMDFRDGLLLLGRAVFERAVADPDSLADLPVVQLMAGEEGGWLGYESISYVVDKAFRNAGGQAEVMDAAIGAMSRPDEPAGPAWDQEDDDENRRHLPRLAELFVD